jgi:transposase
MAAPPPRYKIKLTAAERRDLERLTKTDKTSARKFAIARALLLCDVSESGPGWKVADVADALGITARTIEHLKRRVAEGGVEAALERKPRLKAPRKIIFDGAFAARLTTLACSQAPKGYARWTVRLLAEKVVELKIAPSVSTMTIQRTLKKTNCSLT